MIPKQRFVMRFNKLTREIKIMKTILLFAGYALIIIAALATPIAIGLGLYERVVNDMEFKFALLEGFKLWVIMIGLGLGFGIPCCFASQI